MRDTNQPTCEEKLQIFFNLVEIGMSNIMPERSIEVYPKDAPWMSINLKELMRLRQHAFYCNNTVLHTSFTVTLLTKNGNDVKQRIIPRRCTILKE